MMAKKAVEPISFDEIAHKRMVERLTQYREYVRRHAEGEALSVADMEKLEELLDRIGLPGYAFARDVEAYQRYANTSRKLAAAEAAAPQHKADADRLQAEIEAARKHLEKLREEHRLAMTGHGKATAYSHTLDTLANDHPHLLASIDKAARLRCDELNRRKQQLVGGAA